MSYRASIAITLLTMALVMIVSGGPPVKVVIIIPYWITVAASYLLLFVVILWLKHDLGAIIEPVMRLLEELLYTGAE